MNSDTKTRLIILSVPLMWGFNFPVMKIGLEHMPPLSYGAIRMFFCLAVSWIILHYSKTHQKLAKEDRRLLFLVGFFGFFVFQLLFIIGVDLTTSGNASIVVALLPISVAILSRILKIETISRKTFVVIIFCFIGILLVILGSGKELSLANNHLVGALMLLIGQLFFAYYTIYSKRLMLKYSPYQIITYVFSITTFFFFIVALPELITIEYSKIPPVAWLSNIYSGIFAIGIGNVIWMWGIKEIGSTNTALFNNLVPIFAVIFAFLMLGERLNFIQFVGAAIILIGLTINVKSSKTVIGS